MAKTRTEGLTIQGEPLAIFLGDAHLDTGAWANRPNLSGDSMASFRYIVDKALELGVAAIFGAGDLIDVKKPPPEVVLFVRNQMDRLSEAGVAFYYTQGQHEFSADTPWFSAIHPHPTWVNYCTVELGEFRVFALDWHTVDKLPEALSMVPSDADILMTHQVWEEFMGHKCVCEGSLTAIPTAKTVFTGDFHQNRELKLRGADGQEMTVISPGSTNIRKIDEPADKFFYILYTTGEWIRYQIPTRRKLEIAINNERDLKRFPDTFKGLCSDVAADGDALHLTGDLRQPLARIEYLDTLPDVYSIIRRTTGGHCELFLKPRSAVVDNVSISRDDFDRRRDAGGGSLTSYLDLVVPKTDKRYQMLLRILDSGSDPKLELQRMKKDRGLVGS